MADDGVKRRSIEALAVLAGLGMPTLAHAHGGGSGGLAAGLAHPLLGLDHLVALVAVGLWAVQHGGRGRWALPLGFLGALALGGLLGAGGLGLPGLEPVLLVSVLVLGLLLATAARLPLPAAVLVAAAVGLLHGHAHGTEVPLAASALSYGAGLLLASAAVLGAGLGVALLAQRSRRPGLLRWAGAAAVLLALL